MKQTNLIALVDRLRMFSAETEWLEFKQNNDNSQEIGEYLSALANEACLQNEACGYLVFGIDDITHRVVGTHVDPYTAIGKGSQKLLPWLNANLQPNPGLNIDVVEHPDGRVVIYCVGPARDRPVTFFGKAYVRTGASKVELSRQPEKERALWTRGSDWSAEVCEGASLADLDPEAITKAREQFTVKHPGQAAEAQRWDDVTFLNKARVLRQGRITRTAIILLGRSESATLLTPAVARVSWILKDSNNRELDYQHFDPPFMLAGDHLLKRVRNLTVRVLPGGTLFPHELTQYDPWVIREALHNSIAHQDYLRRGRIVVVETPERVLITNVGDFLPGSVEAVIQQDAPQTIYRNPFLAQAMVELGLIDTQGGGIKRMFETQRRRSFPMPDYDFSRSGAVSVAIPGRVVDERYTRLLMQQPQLSLAQVILLDRVQKRLPIDREGHRLLKAARLVEGRFPNLIVAGTVAKAAGGAAHHIAQRGFDKKWYLDLILELIREHGPVGRKEIDELLVPKLPERLTQQQKNRMVPNLLQELRRTGRILNRGTRQNPGWVISETADVGNNR